MKNKNPHLVGAPGSQVIPTAVAESTNVSELQGSLKSLQQQNALLLNANETLKRKEADLVNQVAALEKAAREASSITVEAEMKAEKARVEIKNLTLAVDQLKQVQRTLETRAKNAESELDAIKLSQSAAVEGAMASENVMAAECKKLRLDLDRVTSLQDSASAKLALELKEAREERDAALDMLASQSLDAETELQKATNQLRHENEALKQSVRALELRATEVSKQLRDVQDGQSNLQLQQQQQQQSSKQSPRKDASEQKAFLEAHEKLKLELRETKSKLTVEVESMTTLLEEEMLNHQTTQQQLRETKAKLDLQNQAVDMLKLKVERLMGETNEMASCAKDSSNSDKALLQSLQSQLQAQTESCNALKELIGSKDHKLASLKLRIDELEQSDAKAVQRHDDVRSRLENTLSQERENQRLIQTLQDAKKKLEERLAEAKADQAAEQNGMSSKLLETSARLVEAERALRENATALEKEMSLSASLQKRVCVLETELAAAREVLSRTEVSSAAALEDLKNQLAAQTALLTLQRDEAIAEATKKVSSLTADVEVLRAQLKSASESAKSSRSELEDQTANLVAELARAKEALRDREASMEATELKRQQAESALLSSTRRADEAEAQCRQERQALMQALQEAELSRSMAAEAEVAAEAAQSALVLAKDEARRELLLQVDSAKRDAEEWQMKAHDAEARAQNFMEQLSLSEREWARQRELLQSAVSSTDSKVQDVQRDAESRLLESNRALFDARNKLLDMQPRYDEAVSLAEKLEIRLAQLEQEKAKCEVNWQIRVDEMEDMLVEAKEEVEQAVRRVQAEAERELQKALDRAAKAEHEAFEANRLANANQSEVALLTSQSRAELDEMTRKNDGLRDDVTQKTLALERAVSQSAILMQDVDRLNASLSALRMQLDDASASAREKSSALESAKLEVDRLTKLLSLSETSKLDSEIRARDALQTAQQASADQILRLQEQLRGESQIVDSLKSELAVATREADAAKKLAQQVSSSATGVEDQLNKWKEMHRDLEIRLQTSSEDLSVMKKTVRALEDEASRKAKEFNAEIARLNSNLEASLNSAQKVDEDLVATRAEAAMLKDKLKQSESMHQEKTEDCNLLVQQLAEAELRAEEMDVNLKRIRAERDDAKKVKADLMAKVAVLEADLAKLSKEVSATESERGKALTELSKQRDVLSNELSDAKRALEDATASFATEKQILKSEVSKLCSAASDSVQQIQIREKRLAVLEQELSAAKEQLNEASEQLRNLRSVEQKLTAATARCDKLVAQADSETGSLKQRLAAMEMAVSEEKTLGTEWRHRAERAEQEVSLAQKDKERAREELKVVKDSVATLERSVADKMAEISSAKAALV
jgi:chromosome segregation ATPase